MNNTLSAMVSTFAKYSQKFINYKFINMKRFSPIIFATILLVIFSCKSKVKYNPEAIELNRIAEKLMKENRNDSALIVLNKASKIDASFYPIYSNKVLIYCDKKDFANALIEADNEIKAKPDLAEGWTFAGMLYYAKGDTIQAKKYYMESIRLFDERIRTEKSTNKHFSSRTSRAVALILNGEDAKAKEDLRKLKEEIPDNKMVDYLLSINKYNLLQKVMIK